MSKRNSGVSVVAAALNPGRARMTPERYAELTAFVKDNFPVEVIALIEALTPMPDDAGPRVVEAVMDLRRAISSGYIMALARYGSELKGNAEAMAILNGRRVGGDLGRDTSTKKKEDRAARIRAKWAEMEAAGEKATNDSVARACEVSRSTVIRAFKSKPAPRTKR